MPPRRSGMHKIVAYLSTGGMDSHEIIEVLLSGFHLQGNAEALSYFTSIGTHYMEANHQLLQWQQTISTSIS